MAITKLQSFNLDTTANYTFANVTATNANLGNAVTANYFIGNLYGTANLATYATTANAVAGANVSGQVSNALIAGTVYTNAQPNITSVGTLTGFTSDGIVNFTNSSNVALGAVGNVHITGGTSGQYLQTDGSGTLTWANVTGGGGSSISNGNSNVNIPTANGNVNISAVGNANILVVTGTGVNVAGTLNATGNVTAGNFVAGTGSGGNLSGANVISANTVTASGNITAGNANLGNAVIANYFIGSGANLTSLPAGNISGQVSNALISSTVYTNAQPNITSIGSLTELTVSNATGVVNFTTTANVTLGAVGNLHISGGTTGQYLQTDGSGTLTWATVISGSSSNISNGNSNVNIPSANGNVNISAVGNANVVVITGTGVNVAGTINATGNVTAGNIIAGNGSGGNISNANVISANTFTASGNITTGNANLGNSVTANYFIGNFYGTANSATTATTAGTVTTNAQPNITSVGTLTGITSTGTINFTDASNTSLGSIANLHILGGTNAYVLSTDGTGNLSWVAQSGGGGGGSSIANGNSNVNIATANGDITISASGNSNIMTITGSGATVTGNFDLTGPSVNLGSVSNLHIGGGTGGYVLQTDGTGNLAWVAQSGGGGGGGGSNIANGTSNVNILYSNGNVSTSVNGNADIFVVTDIGANINGYLTTTGNVTLSGPNVNLGNVSNLRIGGGASGYVLATNGAGALSWVAQTGGSAGVGAIQEFSATSGQTTFTVSGGYTVGTVLVFVNGIQMNNGDYVATDASTVVLSEPRNTGDVVRIVSSMDSPQLNINAMQNFSVAMSIAMGM